MHAVFSRILALVALLGLTAGCGGGSGDFLPGPEPSPSPALGAIAPAAQIASNNFVGLGNFTAQGADPAGLPLTYAWDFDENGTTDSTEVSPRYGWATAGPKPVTLTVTNSLGLSSTARVEHIWATDPPTPAGGSVRAFTLLGAPDTEFTFQAVFLDLGPAIRFATNYEWDFEDDGVVDLVTTEPFAVHVYGSAGAKRCRVRSRNDAGVVGEAVVTVAVCRAGTLPSAPPGVMIGARHAEPRTSRFHRTGGDRLGPLRLTAYGGDPDGGRVTIHWDLDADGVFDDASGRHVDLPDTVEFRGEVRVRMTDDEEQTSESLATVLVTPRFYSEPDSPALVLVESEATTVSPGVPVSFHPDGGVYEWDFDGDGIVDTPGPDNTWRYDQPGIYMPEVRVTGRDGSVSRAYMTIVVDRCRSEAQAPPFFCRAPDTFRLHGGTAEVTLTCDEDREPGFADVVAVGGPPTTYPGGFSLPVVGDPYGLELDIIGPSGRAFVPPPRVPTPRTLLPLSFSVASNAVDGPARTIPYAVTLRLEEPGVRVQVLKALVVIRHEWVLPFFGFSGSAGDYVGTLSFQPPADGGLPIEPVHEIELRFGDQVPPWSYVNGVEGLPPGWSSAVEPDRLRLVLDPLKGQPVGPAGPAFDLTIDFGTSETKDTPSRIELRFLGIEGEVLGSEEAKVD